MSDQPRLCAVVVLYHPSEAVRTRLATLAEELDGLAVVSNGCDEPLRDAIAELPGVTLVENAHNVGLAKALNQGVAIAIDYLNADYVWLLDQDSSATGRTARQLAEAFVQARSNGLRPACIGPLLIDDRKSVAMTRLESGERLHEVPTIATSGSLIPKAVLVEVGVMAEDFFIDCIDHEWCFRARSYGYRSYIDGNTAMPHHMGELVLSVAGLPRPMYSSPTRHYFITRNTVALLRRRYVPSAWRLLEAAKMVPRVILYVKNSSDRKRSFRLMRRGFVDGLHDRLGPLSDQD